MIIRRATDSDAPALREMRIEALASHPEFFAADLDAAIAETEANWIERLSGWAADNRGAIFVAEENGCLLGMAGVLRGHWPKIAHTATIWGVYVVPIHRRKGIANALLEAIVDWARDSGVAVLRLAVVTTNKAAVQSYIKAGFHIYGTEPKSIRCKDIYYDQLLFFREV